MFPSDFSDPSKLRPHDRQRRAVAVALTTALAGAVLPAGLSVALPAAAADADPAGAEAALRAGGVVIAFRHALAPGTFDPPGFQLGDCRTQRNLSDEGRAQARQMGAWFAARNLKPARVRSSPWCRCVDTAQLAFGSAEVWPALGSPHGANDAVNARSLQALRDAITAAAADATAGRFEVWVTHSFVLSALVGAGTGSGEGLVLRPGADGRAQVLARLFA